MINDRIFVLETAVDKLIKKKPRVGYTFEVLKGLVMEDIDVIKEMTMPAVTSKVKTLQSPDFNIIDYLKDYCKELAKQGIVYAFTTGTNSTQFVMPKSNNYSRS